MAASVVEEGQDPLVLGAAEEAFVAVRLTVAAAAAAAAAAAEESRAEAPCLVRAKRCRGW